MLQNKGFTLIELLVVLAIMVVLAVLVISGYHEGRPRLALERTVESFTNDIYRAKQRSMAAMIYEEEGVFFEGGHGIKIDANNDSYTFYAGEVTQTEIELVELENLVKIDSVIPENIGELDIFFPTEGSILFNGVSGGDAIIKFSTREDDFITREVEINSSGIVNIKYE